MPPNNMPSSDTVDTEIPDAVQTDRAGNAVIDRGFLAAIKKSSRASWMTVPPDRLAMGSVYTATSSSATAQHNAPISIRRALNLAGIERGTGSGLSFTRDLRAMRDANPTLQEEWLEVTNNVAEFLQTQ